MVKIIVRDTVSDETSQFRVPPTERSGLNFVHVDFLENKEDELRVDALLHMYGGPIPPELTCQIRPQDGNTGFTFEQTAEFDVPGMIFGIYENGELMGALNVLRIKVISSSEGELTVSAMGFPAIPDVGSDAWHARTMGIMEYILDNTFPTEVKGVSINLVRWEVYDNSLELLKLIPGAGETLINFQFSDFNLRVVESTETLEDGRKVLYMERIPA